MQLEINNDKLIYLQLADFIVDNILADVFEEEKQIPSVAELSASFKINHITALKGVGLLVDEGILYKKRGIGMFVATGAKGKIHEKRKNEFVSKYVSSVVTEAKKLDISVLELVKMIEEEYR